VALTIGSRVGPYHITAEIGAGGMGVVYRAHDSRLGRDVAVKVSAERFSERFEREARAVAALNHPNICTLHDVGPDYLVMELVEGETLADVLAQRPRLSPGLPLDETLRIARQIALALDAAHEAGIVHRDLKPGNIKIRTDGTVKVLDFGLAKIHGATEPASQDIDKLTHSPTLLATQAGLILGTAAYMSPEQARGKVVDRRADIWAFGVVVYEMLAGRRPFDGEDVSTTVAAVIQSEPRWDGVPQSMLRLLKRCLTKDPRRRLRDVGDVWELLDVETPVTRSRTGTAGWIVAALATTAAAVALWAPWRGAERPADRPLVQLEIDLGADVTLPPLVIPTPSSLAISPDGRRLAYFASVSGGTTRLFTRALDQPSAIELAGTEGATNPSFSPDGQWVLFFDGSRLKKISVAGGAAVPLMDAGNFGGVAWTDDRTLLVGSGGKQGLLRASADGGAPTQILAPRGNELFYALPSMLPGGDHALISVYSAPPNTDTAFIDVLTLKDLSRKTVARGGNSARYLPSGHLIYSNRNTVFAMPFDLATREPRGAAVSVLTDVAYDSAAGIPQMDISRDGTLVYRRNVAGDLGTSTLTWFDAAGNRQALRARAARYASTPRVSPDGKKLATTVKDGAGQDVWVYDIERDSMTRHTFGTQTFVSPVWSPDGRFIICGSIGNGLFWFRADGGGQPQPLNGNKGIAFPHAISSDGKRLVYYEVSGAPQIWTVTLDQSEGLKAGRPEQYLSTQSGDAAAAFSPDGRWLAFESNESGRLEIYVRPFPASGTGGKVPVSNNGGTWPIWSSKGHEILYRSGDQVMAVAYTATADSFSADKPRVVMTTPGTSPGFDVAPDGRLLVMIPTLAAGTTAEHTLMFVQNFFDELRRRVPIGKP
jgi:Tol biopolymer transport system component/tRNA A-37 threonylcarbamoyl transferase component Bud32